MQISDSLRQECMPDMVYSLCKLALRENNKEDLQSLITLQSHEKDSISQFLHVYKFALSCGFIEEDQNNKVITAFAPNELVSYRRFCYAVFSRVFLENTKFTQLAKWYLTCDLPKSPEPNTTIFTARSDSEFRPLIPRSIKIDENYFNGFRFWMTALGLSGFYSPGSGIQGIPLVFATHKALRMWLDYSNPFEKGSTVSATRFFNRLLDECPVFASAIDTRNHQISASLSSGLRVLQSAGIIDLFTVSDAADKWQLTNSAKYIRSNTISDLVIKEVK